MLGREQVWQAHRGTLASPPACPACRPRPRRPTDGRNHGLFLVDFVGRLHRAGVPIGAGTDAFAGFTLHAALALYVQAGLSPAEALQIATRNGARFTRTSADRGGIAVGKLADIVRVDGDPTARIADVRKVALVVTQETVISPAQVYRSLGIVPFVDAPALRVLPRPSAQAVALR